MAHYRNRKAREQLGLCAICRDPMGRADDQDDGRVTLDHIVPRSAGGRDSFNNVQAVHYRCNQAKGATLATKDPRHDP